MAEEREEQLTPRDEVTECDKELGEFQGEGVQRFTKAATPCLGSSAATADSAPTRRVLTPCPSCRRARAPGERALHQTREHKPRATRSGSCRHEDGRTWGGSRRKYFNVWPRRHEFLLLEETRRRGCSTSQVHLGCAAVSVVGSFPFVCLLLYPQPEPRGVKTLPHRCGCPDRSSPSQGNSRVRTRRGDAGTARRPRRPPATFSHFLPQLHKKKQRNTTAERPRHPRLTGELLLND